MALSSKVFASLQDLVRTTSLVMKMSNGKVRFIESIHVSKHPYAKVRIPATLATLFHKNKGKPSREGLRCLFPKVTTQNLKTETKTFTPSHFPLDRFLTGVHFA